MEGMQELWSAASYQPHLLSLPFAFAPAAQAQALPDAVPFAAIDVPVLPLDADLPVEAAEPATSDDAFGPAVAGDALDAMRGGTDNKTIITNVSDVDGRVDGNTAVNAITGGNLVDGGAFGNAFLQFGAETVDVPLRAFDVDEAAGDAGFLVQRHHVGRGEIDGEVHSVRGREGFAADHRDRGLRIERDELEARPEALAQLRGYLTRGPVTLLYAARDEEHNNAVALRDFVLHGRGFARG